MPLLTLITNLDVAADEQIPLLSTLSTLVTQLLGKPQSYVMTILQDNQPMLMGGTEEPSAYLQLKSLGLPEDSTTGFSAALCDTITEQLGIPANRIYIEFSNPPRHLWGWNRGTFG